LTNRIFFEKSESVIEGDEKEEWEESTEVLNKTKSGKETVLSTSVNKHVEKRKWLSPEFLKTVREY